MPDLWLAALIILLAFSFDFVNGFHDAANSIATIVSTRVLSPRQAVFWAAFFNFIAAFFFSVAVAKTIGKGVINPDAVDLTVVLAGLVGGVTWDLITWYYGLPSSSSHALIGGLVGAAVMKAGSGAVVITGLQNILLFIVLSPVIGFLLAYALTTAVAWVCRKIPPARADRWFRRLQLLSAALYSLGHGANDAQKTMGVVTMVLVTIGYYGAGAYYIPWWVILTSHAIMGVGTYFGGWRIVKTMGMRITKLRPFEGFCAEGGAAATIIGTALGGIPVSTTHSIAGGIMGVGATRRLSAVRWGVARNIVWAWVLTIPCSALVAAASWRLAHFLFA